VQKPENFLI